MTGMPKIWQCFRRRASDAMNEMFGGLQELSLATGHQPEKLATDWQGDASQMSKQSAVWWQRRDAGIPLRLCVKVSHVHDRGEHTGMLVHFEDFFVGG